MNIANVYHIGYSIKYQKINLHGALRGWLFLNKIAKFVKTERKKAGLTQEEFAMRSGLGLRFVRDLEQGKKTVRMDKVNQALNMFGAEAVPGRIQKKENEKRLRA